MTVYKGRPKSCRKTLQTHHSLSRFAADAGRTLDDAAAFCAGSAIIRMVALKLARMPKRAASSAVRRVTRKVIRNAFARSRWRLVPPDQRRAYSAAVTTEICAFIEATWTVALALRRMEIPTDATLGPSWPSAKQGQLRASIIRSR